MKDASLPRPSLALVLNAADDVAVVTQDTEAGDRIVTRDHSTEIEIVARAKIPSGHKILLRPMRAGEHIHKYGEVIGRLTVDADAGEHVHVHNLVSLRAAGRPEPGSSEIVDPG